VLHIVEIDIGIIAGYAIALAGLIIGIAFSVYKELKGE